MDVCNARFRVAPILQTGREPRGVTQTNEILASGHSFVKERHMFDTLQECVRWAVEEYGQNSKAVEQICDYLHHNPQKMRSWYEEILRAGVDKFVQRFQHRRRREAMQQATEPVYVNRNKAQKSASKEATKHWLKTMRDGAYSESVYYWSLSRVLEVAQKHLDEGQGSVQRAAMFIEIAEKMEADKVAGKCVNSNVARQIARTAQQSTRGRLSNLRSKIKRLRSSNGIEKEAA